MIKNTPIEELIEEYEFSGNDFSNMEWVLKVALRYAETMPDSQVRAILYTLANKYGDNNV